MNMQDANHRIAIYGYNLAGTLALFFSLEPILGPSLKSLAVPHVAFHFV